jgi:hypothetical protein
VAELRAEQGAAAGAEQRADGLLRPQVRLAQPARLSDSRTPAAKRGKFDMTSSCANR